MVGRIGAIADQGVLLGAELGRPFAAIGFGPDGRRDPSQNLVHLLVVKAVGRALQPFQLDQLEIEVQPCGPGAIQQLLGCRHEAGVVMQAMGSGRMCAFGVERRLGQGQHAGHVRRHLRQAARGEGAEPAHLALANLRQLDPEGASPIRRAEPADQGFHEVVVGRGDHLAPGFAHGRGLIHAQHLLGRSHEEDDLSVRVDFQKEISTGEGESEKPGSVVGHGAHDCEQSR